MVVRSPFLAVDWGTTNRRAYRIEDGRIVDSMRDDLGVTAVRDFDGAVDDIRARLGDLPMLLAGMVGSNIGWRLAPYLPVPVRMSDLAAGLLWIDPRTAIIPGVCVMSQDRPDVMRGEEVQLLGAVTAGLVPPDALLAQPGTHCKWADMRGGAITGFTTAMTGELFALLRNHGLLAAQLGGAVSVNAAFHAGLTDAHRRDLTATLFGIRAAGVLGLRNDEDAASYASGLLIGSDVVARFDAFSGGTVHILSGPQLGVLYVAAVEAYGRVAILVDAEAAFIAGIIAIESQSR